MPSIILSLTEAEHSRLHDLAAALQVDPLVLAENLLGQHLRPPVPVASADAFRKAMEHSLTKNAELYRRLAKHDTSPGGAADA